MQWATGGEMDAGGAMGSSWAFEHDQHGISGGLLQAISAGAASTPAWAEVRGGRGFRYGV